jgi:hypothetical protein
MAKNAAPSIKAAETIMFERMSPAASGWRAMASTAPPPIRQIPIPAPIAARPAPIPAPNFANATLATTSKITPNVNIFTFF